MKLGLHDVLRAAVLAAEAHSGVKRKACNEPYINHPMRVALNVAAIFPEDFEAICAAILHDVVEDTSVTEQMLRMAFSGRTIDLVMQVTKISDKGEFAKAPRSVRKAIDLAHYALGTPTAQTIKVCDMLDNAKDIVDRQPDFAEVYLPELATLLKALTKADSRAKSSLDDLLQAQLRRLNMG